ncbi:hypothetical protein ABIG06_006262 [Bradyrhizobium sp. USDA 326]|uniref:IPT/TIG domain-containing protein n=1 Tax=unclassified Bradyrhizobium TaxID=2631580 RepID=UPI00351311E1
MAITYSVPAGQVFALNGPATVTVGASYEEPVISARGEQPDTPVLNSITPSTAVVGDVDVEMVCTGSGFTPDSKIVFNGGDEATDFLSDTEIKTTVKPSLVSAAIDVPVSVRNGPLYSADQTFSFTASGGATSRR